MKPRHTAANPPLMMTTIEMAGHLKVHPSTIYRLIRRHQIPFLKIGSDYRFSVNVIDKWMTDGQGETLKKNGLTH
jgi:excisionase family DNA binding protein